MSQAQQSTRGIKMCQATGKHFEDITSIALNMPTLHRLIDYDIIKVSNCACDKQEVENCKKTNNQ